MYRNCLLAVCLALSVAACSTMQSTVPTPLSYPPLDSRLAEDCPAVEKPASADFDVWENWMVGVLQAYGDCAKRHHETVQAWPKT